MGPHLEGVDKTCSHLFYCALPWPPPPLLVNKELGSNVCSNVNGTAQGSNGLCDTVKPINPTGPSEIIPACPVYFRRMDGNHNQNSLLSRLWARMQHVRFRWALQVLNRTSLTQVCEEAVKAARIDVYGCVPSGSSSAGLIIRTDRWRLLMLIGAFDFYCVKVSTDTCSHGAEWVETKTEKSFREISHFEEWLDWLMENELYCLSRKKNAFF